MGLWVLALFNGIVRQEISKSISVAKNDWSLILPSQGPCRSTSNKTSSSDNPTDHISDWQCFFIKLTSPPYTMLNQPWAVIFMIDRLSSPSFILHLLGLHIKPRALVQLRTTYYMYVRGNFRWLIITLTWPHRCFVEKLISITTITDIQDAMVCISILGILFPRLRWFRICIEVKVRYTYPLCHWNGRPAGSCKQLSSVSCTLDWSACWQMCAQSQMWVGSIIFNVHGVWHPR